MAEDQAAGMPPTAGNTILALGAGEAGPEPAAGWRRSRIEPISARSRPVQRARGRRLS